MRSNFLARWRDANRALMRDVFVAWLATRVGYVLVTYFANILNLFPRRPGFTGMIFSWERWDVLWYVLISRVGYNQASANFFPLFPALMGGISWLLGDGAGPIPPSPTPAPPPAPDRTRMLVGLGLTNVALLVALYFIARLAETESDGSDDRAGGRAVWIVLAYPFAVSWTEPQTDALFLALVAATFYLVRTGRWYPVALAAFLAGLTRPTAATLVPLIAWEFARQQDWLRMPLRTRPSLTDLRKLATAPVAVGAVPAAVCLYFGYLYLRFGDFLLPVHTQFSYPLSHVTMPQWTTLAIAIERLLTRPDTALLLTQVVFLLGFAAITVVNIRRQPFSYTLYMAGLLYLITAAPEPSNPDLLTGTERYLGAAIPVFLVLARWCATRPRLELSLIATGMMLQAVVTIGVFANLELP